MIISLQKKLDRFFQTDSSLIIQGGFWAGSARFLSGILLFGLSISYARFLPKELYGTYRYVLNFLSVGNFLRLSELSQAFMRSAAKDKLSIYRKGLVLQLLFSFLISLFGFGISLYFFFIENTTLSIAFLIASLLVPLEKGTGMFKGWYLLHREFRKKAIATFLIQATFVLFMAGTIYIIVSRELSNSFALYIMIVAYFLGYGLPSLFFFIRTFKRIPSAKHTSARPIFRFGAQLSFADILSSIATYLDSILLFALLGPAAVANLAFAQIIPEQAKGYLISLRGVLAPKIYKQNTYNVRLLIQKLMRSGFIILLGVGMYALIAPIIFTVFFPAYTSVVAYSQIFALGLIAIPFSIVLDTILISLGNLKFIYGYRVTVPIIEIIILLIAIPLFGIWGAIIGKVIVRFAHAGILIFLIKKYYATYAT